MKPKDQGQRFKWAMLKISYRFVVTFIRMIYNEISNLCRESLKPTWLAKHFIPVE